jgi:hypothetical protein
MSKAVVLVSAFLFAFCSVGVLAAEWPPKLACTANAKAVRYYSGSFETWQGRDRQPFDTSRRAHPSPNFPIRDKTFDKLNTQRPVIFSSTPPNDAGAPVETVDFEGTVVLRTQDYLVLMWTYSTRVWTAAIDRDTMKAVVTYTAQTAHGVAGEMETLDCE